MGILKRFNICNRYWWVPAHSLNTIDVPATLSDLKIEYCCYDIIDHDSKELVGYIYEFNCLPGIYHVLKRMLKNGNAYNPMEIVLAK